MPNIVEILKNLPSYGMELFQEHTLVACIAAVVFVFILFFSNQISSFFRKAFVFAVILIGIYAYFKSNWNLLGIVICSLLILLIIRLIGYTIKTIRTNRINKRIEERALERAAKRRGSWTNKQGYSGARKMIVEPEYVPEEMNREEIEEVIRNELSDKKPEDLEDVILDEDTPKSASSDDTEEVTEELTADSEKEEKTE